MLVLSRKEQEKIIVRKDGKTVLEITIVEIQRGRTRLGIHANPDYGIYREEVFDAGREVR